jgi:hypothetical protein
MAETRSEPLSRAQTQVLDDDSESTRQLSLEKLTTWESAEESNLPDGGYGWVVVGCIFLINAHSWGMTSVRPHYYLYKSTTNRTTVLRSLPSILPISQHLSLRNTPGLRHDRRSLLLTHLPRRTSRKLLRQNPRLKTHLIHWSIIPKRRFYRRQFRNRDLASVP